MPELVVGFGVVTVVVAVELVVVFAVVVTGAVGVEVGVVVVCEVVDVVVLDVSLLEQPPISKARVSKIIHVIKISFFIYSSFY